MHDISAMHVTARFSTRTEPATDRAPAFRLGRPGAEPRAKHRTRLRALLVLILLSCGSLLGVGAYPEVAFSDQEGPPDCSAIMARGFPVYDRLSAKYQWLGSCTPHGLRWSVDFHAVTTWARPSNGVVGTFEEQISIERFSPGAEPSGGAEPFPTITIQTKGLCGDDPWVTGVECRDFSRHTTDLKGPQIPFQLKLMVEAWIATRPPLTQGFVGDRAGLAQNRQRQLDEQARAVARATSPPAGSPLAGAVRTVSLLEPSANAVLPHPAKVRVRVARPPGASTSYVFEFMQEGDNKSLNAVSIDAPSAEAGVFVDETTFHLAAWPGRWLVRVRVNGGGGQLTDSPRDYPWSEWRRFVLRQPPVTRTPQP